MRMNKFILTEGYRSRPIESDWALNYIEKNCMKTYNQNWRMYRGVDVGNTQFHYIDPKSKGERVSPHAYKNYYNLYFSNSKIWKIYPQRNKSIICGSTESLADGYGDTFFVFPEDGSYIGICPYFDLWVSFDKFTNSLDDFNVYFDELLHILPDSPTLILSWSDMKDAFNFLDRNKDKILEKLYEGTTHQFLRRFFMTSIKWFDEDISFEKALDDALSPKKNGFQLIRSGDPKPSILSKDDNECWTDGICILVPVHRQYLKIIEDRFGKLKGRKDEL